MYQLLQLSPQVLKKEIKKADNRAEKKRLIFAMGLRSILLILFAIAYIVLFVKFFGLENNSVAVGSFCILLGMRFVSFGYEIKENLLAFGIVLFLMFLGGLVPLLGNHFLALIIHFVFILAILLIVADEPVMGNAGIYVFTYLFMVENPVTGSPLFFRGISLLFVFFLCGSILYVKHHKKNQDCHLLDSFTAFNFKNTKNIWQLRLAFGVSLALFIGHFLNLPRTVWIGYACMSVLLPYGHYGKQIAVRSIYRVGGVILGSILFGLVLYTVSDSFIFIIGPLAGLMIGFSGNYFWDTVLNCFGALLLASKLYGIHSSIWFRIQNNIFGALIAISLIFIFGQIVKKMTDKNQQISDKISG